MTDLIGPASSLNAVSSRPSEGRFFGASDTYFKDCTTPASQDGTQIAAAFLNQMMGLFRAAIRGNGLKADGLTPVVAQDQQDAMLLNSINQLIQRGQANYAPDTGTADALAIAPAVTPAEYKAGMVFSLRKGASPNATNAPTLNVGGLGPIPIARWDASAISAGDLSAGGAFLVFYDGTKFRVLSYVKSDILGIIASASPASGYATFGDANYPIQATDRVIATTAPFTAPRTVTLPAGTSIAAGQSLVIVDRAGAASAANTLTLAAAGSDKIDGAASMTLAMPFRVIVFWSDGAGNWTYDASAMPAYRTVGDAAVTVRATDGIVATSAALTAPRTWTFPAASSVRAGRSIELVDSFGACAAGTGVTLVATGSDKINGQSSVALTSQFFKVSLVSDGTGNWTFSFIDIVQIQQLLNSATSGLEKGWRLAQYTSAASPITALDHQRIEVDVTSGPATVNLPNTPAANLQIDVYRKGTSTNTLTVTTAGGGTVFAFNDGSTDTGIAMGSDTALNIIGLYADGSVYRCNPGIVV